MGSAAGSATRRAVGAIYLRGGTVFVIIAIFGSLALTASAKSAPLAGAWDDLKPWLARRQRDDRAVPADAREQPRHRRHPVRPGRPDPRHLDHRRAGSQRRSSARPATTSATTGGRSPTTSSTTTAGNGPAATTRSGSRATRDTPLLKDTAEAVAKPGTKDVTFNVAPDQLRGTYALSPRRPAPDRPPARPPRGRQGRLLPGDRDRGHDPYTITARVPLRGDDEPGG